MSSHAERSLPKSVDTQFEREITHRIDSSHHANVASSASARRPTEVECVADTTTGFAGRPDAAGSIRQLGGGDELGCDQDSPSLDTQRIGIAHAEDLLDYVQRLSEDLDARSAKLYADIAVQERRERAFRLWAQQRSEDLRNQREACQRERQQLQSQARRMALSVNEPSDWYRAGSLNHCGRSQTAGRSLEDSP